MKSTRIIALILSLTMIFAVFSGCSSKTEPQASPQQSEPVESPVESPAETPVETASPEPKAETDPAPPSEASPDSEPAPETDISGGIDFTTHKQLLQGLHTSLPISNDDITLDYWLAFETAQLVYIEGSDLNNHHIFANMKELTGVDINIIMNDRTTAQEKFNLMAASASYPDIIPAQMYMTGTTSAYEDDVIIDLSDLIPEYAPNYWTILNSNEDIMAGVKTDTDMLLEFYRIKDEVATPANAGAFIRMDWLEKLSMDVPVTYDDLYDVLTAFKTEFGASEPMMLFSTIAPTGGCLIGGYGVNAVLTADQMGGSAINSYFQMDGEVVYGATQEGTREFLQMLNKFYSEGLISEELLTRDVNPFADTTAGYCSTGKVGYFHSNQPFGGVYSGMSEDPDINFWPVRDVVKNEGDIIPFFEEITLVDQAMIAITTACKYPEIAVAWADYWYSYEGYLLSNYGIEGVHWEFDNEGTPQYIPEALEGYDSVNLAFATFTSQDLPNVKADNRLAFSFSDRDNACFEAWSTDKTNDYNIGSKAVFTTEESEAASQIYNDIITYTSECAFKFVNGDLNLEGDWDTYVNTVESMNLAALTKIVQGAYDRAYK